MFLCWIWSFFELSESDVLSRPFVIIRGLAIFRILVFSNGILRLNPAGYTVKDKVVLKFKDELVLTRITRRPLFELRSDW